MLLADMRLIEGVFDKAWKQEMIREITDAMDSIEREAIRDVAWVRVHKAASGRWGIGGKADQPQKFITAIRIQTK